LPTKTEARAKSGEVAFIDLAAQRRRLGDRIDDAIARVLAHGRFIMGPEVAALETELAEFAGTRHAVTCASGTDALLLPLMAKGIGPGDAVIVPAFTFAATAEVAALVGATPVFADVKPDTFNLDPDSLAAAIASAEAAGLRPAAVIAVDLFGQPADYAGIETVARAHGLWIIADAAQSFGAESDGKQTAARGDIAGTSFFPAKPLGCYGDGGAIFTNDDDMAALLKSIRVHGGGKDKYANERIGTNSRLDTIQAAILLEKLRIFPDEIEARRKVAARYGDGLANTVVVPAVLDSATSVWAQYTIRTPRRDDVAAHLRDCGIPTAIYYPTPLHQQRAFADYPVAGNGVPMAEELSNQVLSLPMHPYLDPAVQDRIIAAVREAAG
jgi:dTDP-4-amino-4,6-dideoxygalactose transaminase